MIAEPPELCARLRVVGAREQGRDGDELGAGRAFVEEGR